MVIISGNHNPKATRREIIETLTKQAVGENTVVEEYKEENESKHDCNIFLVIFSSQNSAKGGAP